MNKKNKVDLVFSITRVFVSYHHSCVKWRKGGRIFFLAAKNSHNLIFWAMIMLFLEKRKVFYDYLKGIILPHFERTIQISPK